MDRQRPVDVVVIGGGLAGLQAAYLLHRHGAAVALLEANTRTGGRIQSHASSLSPELVIERGGELVGRHHGALRSLCMEANVPLIDIDEGGGGILPEVVLCDGVRLTGRAWQQLERELGSFVAMVGELAQAIDPLAPLRTSAGRNLCDITVEDWMTQRGISATLTRLFCDHAPHMQCTAAMLALVAAADDGSFFQGGESATIEGGAGRITAFLTRALGDTVRLGHRVDHINRTRTGFVVSGRTARGRFRQRGCAVIVATPPPCWPGLDQQPVDPPTMTANRKVILELGDRSAVTSAVSDGPCRLIWPSPQMTARSGHGTILGMLALPVGPAPTMASSALAASACALIGISPDKVTALHETRWDRSPFSRGAYPVLGSRALRALPGTMATDGGLTFAGDWTSPGWCGLMEGAVKSGRHAASRILSYLAGSDDQPGSSSAVLAQQARPLAQQFGLIRGEPAP